MAVQTGSCLAWPGPRRLVFFLMGLHVLYLRKDNLSNLLVVLYHVILNANSTLRKHAYAIYYDFSLLKNWYIYIFSIKFMGFANGKKNQTSFN